ncbi:MAG: CheR family methyltransferase, partial [Thermodesulfobacteriota bacterium]
MLLDHFERPWKGYRKVRKGVKKRISRHMQEIGTRNMAAYLDRVDEDPAVRRECLRRMTVSISRFFRERRLWNVLRESVLPDLISRGMKTLRVWSAGCAGGEEPYSFRIIWEEVTKPLDRVPALDLLSTDTNPENLDRAQKGVYTRGSLKEADPSTIAACFDEKKPGKTYRIKPELKEG